MRWYFAISKANGDHFRDTVTLALPIKMSAPPHSISGLGFLAIESIRLHHDVFQTTINTCQPLVTTLAVTLAFPVCLHCHSAYRGSISNCLFSVIFPSSQLNWLNCCVKGPYPGSRTTMRTTAWWFAFLLVLPYWIPHANINKKYLVIPVSYLSRCLIITNL